MGGKHVGEAADMQVICNLEGMRQGPGYEYERQEKFMRGSIQVAGWGRREIHYF